MWPWLAVSGGLVFLIIAGLGGAAYASQQQTIVRHVTVAGQNIGGLNRLTALHRVEARWQAFTSKAYIFSANGQNFSIPTAGQVSDEDETVVDLVGFDPIKAVNDAYGYGHRGPWWQQARQRLSGFIGREHTFGLLALDTKSIAEEIHKKLVAQEKPPTNAGLNLSEGKIQITPSATGQSYDYRSAVHQVRQHTLRLEAAPMTIHSTIAQPEVTSQPNLQTLAEQQVPGILARAPITVSDGEKKWTIDQAKVSELLGWRRAGRVITVGFDTAKTTGWINSLKNEAEVQPQNAKFTMTNGKVQEFQASAIGHLINVAATLDRMNADIIVAKGSTTSLVVNEIKPITDTTTTNNLGITELVAQGKTNFRGSPTNRRFNLTYGSHKLNGLLIAPGETFSLVTALGKIDAAHGWKSELVIKGADITPEFGGGLCQVATTLFRAILNSGLPVVERHNHSLRIRYYEPPIGLDATIYEPKPDLRFTNDYTFYLLLQTSVDGDDLTYSFYGTKDGRTVDIPEPKVYNRTAIPATKTIEVDDLKPGEEKCQAPGHPGADATATYTVTKADGSKVTQVFQSHYRALGVICHVGKKPAPKPKPAPTNTNTNTNADIVITNS